MAAITRRRLPVGIQSFKKIREENFLYVDKSDIVWQLVNNGVQYNYLSRPRRFGKSVLVDTLQAYFEGRRELFEGLKIMELEQDWIKHPVIRLDMSRGGANEAAVRSYFHNIFKDYEQTYSIPTETEDSLAVRFHRIIKTAYEKTNQQVVILIDEYDSPLQHSWHTPEHEGCIAVYRDVFAILKADDEYEEFVFITGTTKFMQISLFSALNNISNISFEPQFATICGISKQEIVENFMPEIEQMAQFNKWTVEETLAKLKDYYGGYHFCRNNIDGVYNPASLINALYNKEPRSNWASSGTTFMPPKFANDMELRLEHFDNCPVLHNILETSDVTDGGIELFLYQSGYLTIKDCDEFGYILGIPNEEARQTLNEALSSTQSA